MVELFSDEIQKAGARYLKSKSRLNDFSLAVGIGAVIVAVVFGVKLIGSFTTIFGL